MLTVAQSRVRVGAERPTVDDVEAMLSLTGDDLEQLMHDAAALRDQGLADAGIAGIVTYSRKVFLPITTLCRDRCHYCIFVDTPSRLHRKGQEAYMRPEQILQVAREGAARGCKEALFTLGDRPEDRWPEARTWLDEHGYASTLEYVRAMAELVRRETGLLPHLNPGVMSLGELEWLRPVAPSMGMMLETTSRRLFEEPGQVHFGSPDKDPAVRLQVIADAGRARIPFTTGILVGIGETLRDRAESIIALRDLQDEFGHIQEVIVQNFRAKPLTAMRDAMDASTVEHLAAVAATRMAFGPGMRVQVPPNLADPGELGRLLGAGADDWGGVSPLTADHVNPERPWPHLDDLAARTAESGFALRERLTAHPPYLREPGWLDPSLVADVGRLMDPATGLADARAVQPAGRAAPAVHVSGFRQALARAADRPDSLSDADALSLLAAEDAELDELAAVANDLRRYTVGEAVSYVVNRNIASSAFGGPGPDAIDSFETLGAMVDDAWELGATEICMQGLLPAALPADTWLELARTVKRHRPEMHLHAFRPQDIADGARRAGRSIEAHLAAMRRAGVDTVPGTGVKVLDDEVRLRAAPGDIPVAEWESVIRAAHAAGLRSTSVLFFGLGETAAQRIAHIRRLAAIQSDTGGFTEFVPIPFGDSAIVAGRGPLDEHRAVVSVARLLLHGRIDHIQVAWTRAGLAAAPALLRAGADDLGGTLLDGRVLPAAGAEQGLRMTMEDAARIANALARPLRQRTTVYGEPAGRAAAGSAVA